MNLLNFYVPEWIFVAVNLIILTLVLRAILWKRVNRVLEERRALMEKGLQDAAEAKAAVERLDAERIALEDEMHRQTAEQMKQARTRAGHEYDRIVREAEEKANKLISAAHAQSEQQKTAMMMTAKSEIANAALDMVGALLEANMDSEQNRRLIESYLDGGDSSVALSGKGGSV